MSTVAKIVTYVLGLFGFLAIFILVRELILLNLWGITLTCFGPKQGDFAVPDRKIAATNLVAVLIFGIFCTQGSRRGLEESRFRPFCAEAIHCCRLISSLKEDAHAVHNDFGW